MADETGMGAGARGALGAGAAVIVVLLGYLGWSLSQPAPVAPVPVSEAPAADTGAADTGAAEAVASEAAQPAEAKAEEPSAEDAAQVAAPAAEAPPVPPSFDVVRVEPDGSATVAGSAAADAKVSLRVDGAEVAQAQADGQGKFAALFTLAASDVPRLLSLVAILADGTEIAAVETVALAPTQPVAVTSAEAPAAVLLTEEGAQLLQPGSDVPPEVLANVSVDTITYTPEGEVQLGGRGQGAGFVRIYLDDAEKGLVEIGADGMWAATLADVAPGIYTLRVDQIGADGKVTSRFETPFKRETLEALAAASAPAAAEPAVAELAVPEPTAAPEPAAEPETAVAEPAAEPEAVAAGTEAAAEVAPAGETAPAESAAVESAAVESVPTESLPAEPVTAEPVAPPAPVTITVQPGFTLWGIAEQSLGDGVAYVQVFEANKDKIRDPDLIYPGQVFTIPAAE